jgi:hypothetical protein
MASLSNDNKSRCRWHLGYIGYAGIPEGDAIQLEEAMNTIADSYTVGRIEGLLDRCDRAFDLTEIGASTYTSKELITGDINRSVIKTSNSDIKQWRDNYLDESDQLALALWVPNYRRIDTEDRREGRESGEWIKRLPGIADSCVGTRIWVTENYV